MPCLTLPCLAGSSPRAWGTRYSVRARGRSRRFIPTCMGNSSMCRFNEDLLTVHPHVHGELHRVVLAVSRTGGSSPRAWGTHCDQGSPPDDHRFIPTCMGNSRDASSFEDGKPVHPHVHGELRQYCDYTKRVFGSSPRAWGTHHTPFQKQHPFRFIPTCMGNSFFSTYYPTKKTVHPHVHGELSVTETFNRVCAGSSPRAWGTLLL